MKTIFFLFFLLATPLLEATCCKTHARVAYGWWAEADYLFVWRKDRFYPPIATTGILGDPDTEILFGDQRYAKGPKSGAFFDAGIWITSCIGFGGSLMLIGTEHISFDAENPPTINLSRPFFDLDTGLESVFPLTGTLQALHFKSTNNFWILDGYLRWPVITCPCWAFTFIGGYGYGQLTDGFEVEDEVIPEAPGIVIIKGLDKFLCRNEYWAGLFGFVGNWSTASWGIDFWGKVYFGNMLRELVISGERQSFLPSGAITIEAGDLFSQPSNIGTHKKHSFQVVPITGINLQLKIWCHVTAQVGYFYAFLPRVFLSGEQIDLNINLVQTDPATALPKALQHDTSFYYHGLSLGLFFKY